MDRIDALYKAMEKVTAKAKGAKDPSRYVKLLKSGGVGAARDAIRDKVEAKGRRSPGQRARRLPWRGGSVGDQAQPPDRNFLNAIPSAPTVKYLDELFAEILDGGEAVKEILGARSDLADALKTIAQLSAGRIRIATTRMENACVGKLNSVMAVHHLPLTRRVLIERGAQGIRGIQPLTREAKAPIAPRSSG